MRFTMTSLLPLLLFSSLFFGCFSAVFFERQRVIPGHEKQCYDKSDGVYYKKEEEMKWNLKGCGRKICLGSNGKEYSFVEIHTCGKIHYPPECHIEVDSNLPYPYCCEKIICPKTNKTKVNAIHNSH